MSAIAAIYHKNGAPIVESDLIQLHKAMAHHGEDAGATWFDNECGLAQQSTRITTESLNEHLPHYSREHKIALATHCRLFNRDELCEQLNLTMNRSTISDSELILLSYLKWKLAFVNYLVGEFSIALWDAKEHQLICATDHVNSRPLYYYANQQMLIVATEINALHQLKVVPRLPNFSKIARSDFLRFQLAPGETCFENIQFLPAASLLVQNNTRFFTTQYWQPALGDCHAFKSENHFREAFQSKFYDAIRSTTRTHLPICLQFSGGLDSSAIAVMTLQHFKQQGRNLVCLSNGHPDDSHNSKKNKDHHYIKLIKASNLIKEWVVDEWRGPFDDLNTCSVNLQTSPQHYQHRALNAAARRHQAKIVLHGTLGEITASYAGHEYLAYLFCHGHWHTLFREARAYKKIYNHSIGKLLATHIMQTKLPLACKKILLPSRSNKLIEFSLINTDFIREYIEPEQLRWITNEFLNGNQLQSLNPRKNALFQLNQFLRHSSNLFNQLNEGALTPVYLSNPYFDKRFIEFCLNIPNEYRFKQGYPRSIIRTGMQNLLPQAIRYRTSKESFLFDYQNRYHKQLKIAQLTLEELASNTFVQTVIDIKKLKKYLYIKSTSSQSQIEQDFINYMIVPRMIYLAKFLASF